MYGIIGDANETARKPLAGSKTKETQFSRPRMNLGVPNTVKLRFAQENLLLSQFERPKKKLGKRSRGNFIRKRQFPFPEKQLERPNCNSLFSGY